MELLIIFVLFDILAAFLSFYNNGDLLGNIFTFILLGGLGAIIFTMRVHDFLIYRAISSKKYKKAIRMYKNKLKVTPNSKSRNGILLNLVPLYFMIDDIDNAREYLKKVDFLTLKKPILKSYYQLLQAYLKYKEGEFEKLDDYLESALNYEKEAKTTCDLLKLAVEIKKNPEKDLYGEFKKLPDDVEEYYFEPFDKLYLELAEDLKMS